MKKWGITILKSIIIGLPAIILVTIGLDAADHYNNLSDSLIVKLVSHKAPALCPEDMILVLSEKGNFCFDKFEAAANPNCPYPNAGSQNETRINLSADKCQPVAQAGSPPWRFISQSQAAVACAKAGKRLPTSEEWYSAALGTPDNSETWSKDDCQVNSNWASQPGLTGAGKNCRSAAGAYDLIGNVWEWVKGETKDGSIGSNILPPAGYIKSVDSAGWPLVTDETDPDSNYNNDYLWIKEVGVRAIARGGYWNNQAEAGLYSMYLVLSPAEVGPGIGFRCVK